MRPGGTTTRRKTIEKQLTEPATAADAAHLDAGVRVRAIGRRGLHAGGGYLKRSPPQRDSTPARSAPRPVGSHLIVDGEQNFLGSVSGGCVEGDVIAAAGDVIESGKPKMLEFGVADETAWRSGLSCGGNIRVYVEKVD